MYPAVYELDENGEATGTTYRFCNDTCANAFRMESLNPTDQFPRYSWGKETSLSFDGENCMNCGNKLPIAEEVTPVIFRIENETGEPVALFPTFEHSGYSIVCYAHLGQHSGADWGTVINNSRPATESESAPLKKELESLGYVLKVYSRGAHLLHYRNRKRK